MFISFRCVWIEMCKPPAQLHRHLSRRLISGWLVTLLACGFCLPTHAQIYRALNSSGEASPGDPSEIARDLRKAQLAVETRLNAAGDPSYKSVQGSAEWGSLRAASARLRAVELKRLDTPGRKIAFWINVYNALVLDGTISFRARGSVLNVQNFFQRVRYNVGGYDFCLDDIEHGLLRGNKAPVESKKAPFQPDDPRLAFAVSKVDPRIHFALSCGAKSCPAIFTYDADKIETQLDSATKNFVNGPDVKIEPKQTRIVLSQIFQWYADDFGPKERDVLRFVDHYLNEGDAKQFLEIHLDSVSIRYSTYDWALAHKP